MSQPSDADRQDGKNETPSPAAASASAPETAFALVKKKKLSVHKGVYWNKTSQKWRAQMHVRGKNVFLGNFASEEEAARAYNLGHKSYFNSPKLPAHATEELSPELDARRKRVACKIERLKAEIELAEAEEELVTEQGPTKQRRIIKRLRLKVELVEAQEELLTI